MGDTKEIKVYLAGKIEKNDWRSRYTGALPDFPYCGMDPLSTLAHWPTEQTYIRNISVTGPYFLSCDHGCSFHGDGSHGVASGDSDEGDVYPETRRRHVKRLCLDAIDRCDVFFAWLDERNCTAYGTLVELGYAKAAGKIIVIGRPKGACATFDNPLTASRLEDLGINTCPCGHDDIWFAGVCADHVIVASDPHQALAQLSSYSMRRLS